MSARASKARDATTSSASSSVIRFPATPRDRARFRRLCRQEKEAEATLLALEMGWTFVPPAAKKIMQLYLGTSDRGREVLDKAFQAVCAEFPRFPQQ